MIHEVVLRWEQGDGEDGRRRARGERPQVDHMVTLMHRATFSLSAGHIVIEKDGVVVREWRNGQEVAQPFRTADGEVVEL